jgi:hypothetical protein
VVVSIELGEGENWENERKDEEVSERVRERMKRQS